MSLIQSNNEELLQRESERFLNDPYLKELNAAFYNFRRNAPYTLRVCEVTKRATRIYSCELQKKFDELEQIYTDYIRANYNFKPDLNED